jgi:uncharacterized protein (DUF1778 family)
MRQKRMEFRTSDAELEQFEAAAQILGMNLSSFLRTVALERSSEILRRQDSILLNNRDREAFLAALDNPPEPNKELKKAYQEYKRLVKRK